MGAARIAGNAISFENLGAASCSGYCLESDCVNTLFFWLCQTIVPVKSLESGFRWGDCLKSPVIFRIYTGNPRIGCNIAS